MIRLCQGALDLMCSSHFDADSSLCMLTLIKYVDNVIHKPGEQRTRQIRCGNKAFQQKVGCIRGGEEFLKGVGFVLEEEG
ncbi:unnamed protein product, partial [Choristocarpus tenellus]